MSKFKVGDKVRVLSNDSCSFKEMCVLFEVGDVTIITRVWNDSLVGIGNYSSNLMMVSEIELVENKS